MKQQNAPPVLRRVRRLDSIRLDADDRTYFTEEGYLVDHPVLTSVGIFEYRKARRSPVRYSCRYRNYSTHAQADTPPGAGGSPCRDVYRSFSRHSFCHSRLCASRFSSASSSSGVRSPAFFLAVNSRFSAL